METRRFIAKATGSNTRGAWQVFNRLENCFLQGAGIATKEECHEAAARWNEGEPLVLEQAEFADIDAVRSAFPDAIEIINAKDAGGWWTVYTPEYENYLNSDR
jgi:hypothetical protein